VDLRRWWTEEHFPEEFDRQERAALMEYDGGLTREEAERAARIESSRDKGRTIAIASPPPPERAPETSSGPSTPKEAAVDEGGVADGMTTADDGRETTPPSISGPGALELPAGADDRPSPAAPSVGAPARPAGPDGWGPPPADHGWHNVLPLWPIPWREKWGRRANELEDQGQPSVVAEWTAFCETARDLAEAEDRGEVPESSYPDPAAHDGLSDEEVVAGIALAFGDGGPAPAGPSRGGPRDFRRGDRWLPWHFPRDAT
jgi:hypothetical protein